MNKKDPWAFVFKNIQREATRNGMTDVDAWVAWAIGLASYKRARGLGCQFPHDSADFIRRIGE